MSKVLRSRDSALKSHCYLYASVNWMIFFLKLYLYYDMEISHLMVNYFKTLYT